MRLDLTLDLDFTCSLFSATQHFFRTVYSPSLLNDALIYSQISAPGKPPHRFSPLDVAPFTAQRPPTSHLASSPPTLFSRQCPRPRHSNQLIKPLTPQWRRKFPPQTHASRRHHLGQATTRARTSRTRGTRTQTGSCRRGVRSIRTRVRISRTGASGVCIGMEGIGSFVRTTFCECACDFGGGEEAKDFG
jgi:hypothetical protein